jgi:hypothetical protein
LKIVVGIGLVVVLTLAVAHAHDPITTRVTWNGEIARIVEARCVGCHSPDGRGPMSLATYEDARPWAKAIKEEVMTRRMPKWHAVRGYGDFSNDASLSPFEIALMTAWADGGAPKGPAAPAPPRAKPRLVEIDEKIRGSLQKVRVVCGEQPLPSAVLVAVRPELERGGSVGIAVRLPDGSKQIVAWIRDYDPDFPTTYWLRSPLTLPAGSLLTTEPRDRCSITVTLKTLR